ncbi:MAG: hypothetical protein ACK470_06340 [Pseudanabaena sp.]
MPIRSEQVYGCLWGKYGQSDYSCDRQSDYILDRFGWLACNNFLNYPKDRDIYGRNNLFIASG